MRWLGLCKTGTVMDYRPVLFLEEGGGYAVVRSRSGRSAVVRVERGKQCVGVSREVALLLYPELGWEHMPVEAPFQIERADPVKATRVVMRVPFGIGEVVVRRQLLGYPIYEGAIALEFMDHIEFGEVVHVEPRDFSVVAEDTALRLVEVPVEENEIVYARRR
ncbi:hypothetical protein TUZN_0710 [Thermoproteus uzoniensis 768-20]|uniref:Uncharacterized protein n=1 Tax=Thermoproteus uzoniensis (strain 768-20) TaxID=999630 RepID=F2L4M2_THEU7|nr:hypothetical protein [Thermoproteus uzoniensis]AEA12200.1 hypothetical protein TUZN_0710 [Thermoproteus uzoniensis 768-20]